MRDILKYLRDDTSMIVIDIKRPRANALFSSHLKKYVVSMSGEVARDKVKKMMGFQNVATFNIIVDIEEEVYKNVFIKEISKVRFIGDCCDIIDSGSGFSVFWRNQTEPRRSLRIYFKDGTELEFTKHGSEFATIENNN